VLYLYLDTFEVQYLLPVFKILFGYVSISVSKILGKISYTALLFVLGKTALFGRKRIDYSTHHSNRINRNSRTVPAVNRQSFTRYERRSTQRNYEGGIMFVSSIV